MNFEIKLDVAMRSGNDAFADCPSFETARILRELADDIEEACMYAVGNLTDVNGNTVGSFMFHVEEKI